MGNLTENMKINRAYPREVQVYPLWSAGTGCLPFFGRHIRKLLVYEPEVAGTPICV